MAEFGHDPLWEPIEPGSLDLGRSVTPLDQAAIVGSLGEFKWYAVAVPEPHRVAPLLARKLAERGRICGVFGLDTELRQLGVSVALDRAPALVVDLDAPDTLATSCLRRIGASEAGGPLGIASRTADALLGTGLGRQFFAAFRATLDRFVSALPADIPARHRHELALLHLTRVLFLYFVQAKGWLDGSEHFVRDQVDDALFHRRSVHRSLLLPLFFGTLNQPIRRRRGRALRFGRVPFLNGGLFEPHRLERLYRAEIPDATWRDAFDALFERYHFTVREEEATGSIAPDMLGKVFEGVMEPAVRKRTGTFYTPGALVRSMVDAGLAGFVGGCLKITDGEALARLERGDREAAALLEHIAILDPAVGSGAFLLGALERLVALRARGGLPASARTVVTRNLYGVDLNPSAIQLCELRLWLAIISREPDGGPESVEPLPNLDAFVRQGDSLADPLRLMLRHPLRASRHAEALRASRTAASAASGTAKRDAVRRLRRVELDMAAERLESAIAERESEVAALLAAARDPTLFGEQRGLDRRGRKAVGSSRAELKALRSTLRLLRSDGVVPSFDFDTHFGDVTSRGGFDLVIGNPPWVRAEELPAAARNQLRERFRWWRAGSGKGYGHQPDLAVAFLERGWELTRPGGVMAMLVPAKVATAGYGVVVRAALEERGTILALADLTQAPTAEFDATTYPLGLVVRHATPPADHRPRLGLQPGTDASSAGGSTPGAPWPLVGRGTDTVLRHLQRFPPLAGMLRIQLGVKTGANHLFLAPSPAVEAEVVRPALRGRDVRAFRCTPSARIVWTHGRDGTVLRSLPPGATRHFLHNHEALRGRADHAGEVPWCVFRAAAGSPAPRVAWADLAPRLEAVCLADRTTRPIVPLNSCYVVRCESAGQAGALCAWLNSTWARAVARAMADPASGGYARFNARSVGCVPLPPEALDDPSLTHLAHRGGRGEEIQGELDECTGEWLELTARDRQTLSRVVGVGAARRR